MQLVKPLKADFQPFTIEITTPEQATLMFALFNFVPITNAGVTHNLENLSEQIVQICPAVLGEYDSIHAWLNNHWKHN